MVLKLDNKEKDMLITSIEAAVGTSHFSADVEKKYISLHKKIEKSMLKIKPRSAKNKGLNFQKKIAEFIGKLIGIEASQDDESLIQSRLASQNGTDIILRGEAKKKFPFAVECKDCNTLSLPAWISQAKSNETDTEHWILFVHSQLLEDKDIVVMKLEDFGKLFKGEYK